MSDDTPTEIFTPSPGQVEPNSSATSAAKTPRSKALLIALSVIGGLLLVAVIVLLTLLFTKGTDGASPAPGTSTTPSPHVTTIETPSVSPSETPSATATSTPTTPPAAQGPRFTAFNAPASQMCSAAAPGFPATRPTFTVSWATAGAVEAWFINGTDDAKDSGFMQIPLSGDQDDFPYIQGEVGCGDSNTYTITLVGPDGKHVSKTWKVMITGDHF